MRAWHAAFVVSVLAAPLACQDAAGGAKARAALEAAAVKGDQRALAQAIARRPGDWFDVVLSVVAEPMPPLEPTRALIAALPDPERSGVAAVLDSLVSGPGPGRQGFAVAFGALSAPIRAFGEPRADAKAVAEASTAARERIAAAGNAWLSARGTLVDAMAGFEAGLAGAEPAIAAAVESLTAAGDRFGAAFALAFHAKALADKGDLAGAAGARERARSALGTSAGPQSRPPRSAWRWPESTSPSRFLSSAMPATKLRPPAVRGREPRSRRRTRCATSRPRRSRARS
jgi:hypothetical protein